MSEFKIGRLRYTWKGQWQTATFYNRDAVIQYNGRCFTCLVPHTSSVFNTDLNYVSPAGAITPYWTLSLDGRQWKQPWAPTTLYEVNNVVTYGGVVYICVESHTSATAIDLQKWTTLSTFDSWNSAWTVSTIYGIGDVVKYGGIVYRCTVGHASDSSATVGLEIDASKWEIVNNGIEYRGVYNSGSVRYRTNDIVKQGSDLWRCTTGHASGSFNLSNWALWLPGEEFLGTWSNSTQYQSGDVVIYGGYSYVSSTNTNVGNIPSPTSTAWSVLTKGYSIQNAWNNNTAYKVGDVVTRGGRLFVAVSNHSGQDPNLRVVTSQFTQAGTTGTTVKLYSTLNIVPNLAVLGNGFTRGQRVASVVDATTITVSEPADSATTDGSNIFFIGINYDYWALVNTSVNWVFSNFVWQNGVNYALGDVVVWQNATYVCAQNHLSNYAQYLGNRPDQDITGSYWNVYIKHAPSNVLNTQGDILAYNAGTRQAIPIGPSTYVLKSVNNTPTWQTMLSTTNVYYVATNGADIASGGISWDNPWRTIKYACDYVARGTLYQNTAAILKANKTWITTEAINFINYSKAQSINGYSPSYYLDVDKTTRDMSYIIDAVVYDITRGGNSQTVAATLAYFLSGSTNTFYSTAGAAQIPFFLPVLNFLATQIGFAINQSAPANNYQVLNSVATPVAQTIGLAVAEAGAQSLVNSLTSIVVTALTNQSTLAVPTPNTGITVTINVKSGTYTEILPITIPANVGLVGDELRAVIVQPLISINTICTSTTTSTNVFTVITTAGMYDKCPVQFVGTPGGVVAGQTYYVIGSSITGNQFSVSASISNSTPVTLGTQSGLAIAVYGGQAIGNMFYLRNGSGLRNMTLSGLLGTLGAQNANLTQRPTGGAYTSLDPGTGPSDTSAWIYRRSPYVQNVSTFGVGCTGLKIDGTLHNGGNKSIVANDFTQIISDGIGAWVTGSGALSELVSVFSYYAYTGYFAEAGGRIRATNGNSSYGTFGAIAEGYDALEVPITASVYNYSGSPTSNAMFAFTAAAPILKLQYSNAGVNFNNSNFNLLSYSNNYIDSSWSTPYSDISYLQSIVSPFGDVNAWVMNVANATTNQGELTQTIGITSSGGTFTGVSGTNVTGSGSSATFNITVNSSSYVVSVNVNGNGYVVGNQILITGATFGGITGLNDLVLTVATLSGSGVATVTSAGTVPTGSLQRYVLSVYVKQYTSNTVEIFGSFTGSSTASSAVQYNFATGVATGSAAGGVGIVPTVGVSYISNGWYRLWMSVYDPTGLNTSLAYKLYPRSRTGTATGTYMYGAQINTGSAPTFYLETEALKTMAYANYRITGSGAGVLAIGNETRSTAVYQVRVLSGGTGYTTAQNQSQGGDITSIVLAGSVSYLSRDIVGLRIFINSGVGSGQYGVISNYVPGNKTASIIKETFTPLTVTSSTSPSTLTLSAGQDVSMVYADQPIQFIPTSFTFGISSISQAQITATTTVGGTTNTMTVTSTARLQVGMAITFSGTTFGSVSSTSTFFVFSIIDSTTIQISTSQFAGLWQLSPGTGSMTLNYPALSGYIIGDANCTANMAVNNPIEFQGTTFGSIVAGTTYYVNDIVNSNTFTISAGLVYVTVSSTANVASFPSNIIVGSTSSLVHLNPIIFDTTVGLLIAHTKYYINRIINSITFTVTNTLITTVATATATGSNLITVTSTAGFTVGNPIIFSGTTFGGIVAERVYYVQVVNDATTFTVSATAAGDPGVPTAWTAGGAVGLNAGTGSMFVRTGGTDVTMSSVTATSYGTSTGGKLLLSAASGSTMVSTLSIPLFGNVSAGTTYYVKTVTPGTNPTITLAASAGGATLTTITSYSGSMQFGHNGWDHIVQGTPPVSQLDGTSVYYIEPAIKFSLPPFSQVSTSIVTQPNGSNYISIAYGNNMWLALPNGSQTVAKSTDGVTWTSLTLPYATGGGTWQSIAYGNGHWVIIVSGGTRALYSNSDGQQWKTATLPNNVSWSRVTYGNGIFVAVSAQAGALAWSDNNGRTWASSTATSQSYVCLTYGNGVFLAMSSDTGGQYIRSTDGKNWTAFATPVVGATTVWQQWSDIAYGNGRFVVIGNGAATGPIKYSFDGITWYATPKTYNVDKISYGQGVFVAVSIGNNVAYTSEDGLAWTAQTVTASNYSAMAFGYTATTFRGTFVTASNTNISSVIYAGARTKARSIVGTGVLSSLNIFEPGSNYSSAPTVTISDPNNTTFVSSSVRLGASGVLASPTFYNRGLGYTYSSTVVYINGDGYRDDFQTGLTMVCNNLTRLPSPGDDLVFTGNSIIYKVTSATALYGTIAPNITATLTISPEMTVELTPANGTVITIRTRYSQVRLTGHDFLNVGYGNQTLSNYPNLPTSTSLAPQNQCVETDYGRVFFTSSDQDGNFNVGNLFAVQQATGIVTLSASQFGLSGLSTLSLGGISVGNSNIVVTQFSTDATFVANTDAILPTQRAIKSFLGSRLSQGGSNTFTGQTTAGTVVIGGADKIATTVPVGIAGSNVKMPDKINISGPLAGNDGNMSALFMFMKTWWHR
jgi:hypothetical protein